ncbi:ribosome biogenesis GTPase [Alteromonadaceae bacterium Bs31]|nr:ribosome biogenesis GTPase [Alteromonadaceae bacterium Bs31]
MSKRKLSHQQTRRIAKKQQQRSDQSSVDSDKLQAGTVLTRYSKQADVEAEDGTVWRCHLRANLGDVVSGDKVVWAPHDDESGVIESVNPAKNKLERPDSYGKMRAVASNIDQMLITIAIAPEPHAGLIDRYLVVAENLEIEAVLVINKTDLIQKPQREFMDKLREKYKKLGYLSLDVCAKDGHGLDELKRALAGKTSIFAGQSGVGKSSLIQVLLPDEPIKIGELSEQVAKGRHTTTHSRLYHFPDGGDCIDSPGIREFGLWHFAEHEVLKGFIELRELAGTCKFRDCRHLQEPGCAIIAAHQQGTICNERFDSFRRITHSLDEVDVKR